MSVAARPSVHCTSRCSGHRRGRRDGVETGHVENSLAAIEQALTELSQLPPAAEQAARGLFDALISLHGLALTSFAAALARTEDGAAEFERLADTEPLRAVLLLHGLHPVAADRRARRAVDRMRPEILSRGCHLGPVEISSGVLRVRLHGADAAKLRSLLQDAIFDAAPDLSDAVVEISGTDRKAEGRGAA